MSKKKQAKFFSRPDDRSLAVFKEWLRRMTRSLGGTDNMTEARWVKAWKKFWS